MGRGCERKGGARGRGLSGRGLWEGRGLLGCGLLGAGTLPPYPPTPPGVFSETWGWLAIREESFQPFPEPLLSERRERCGT